MLVLRVGEEEMEGNGLHDRRMEKLEQTSRAGEMSKHLENKRQPRIGTGGKRKE